MATRPGGSSLLDFLPPSSLATSAQNLPLSQHAPSGWDPGLIYQSVSLVWLSSFLFLLVASLLSPFSPPHFPIACFLLVLGAFSPSALCSSLASCLVCSLLHSSKLQKQFKNLIKVTTLEQWPGDFWPPPLHVLEGMCSSCRGFYKSLQLCRAINIFWLTSCLPQSTSHGQVCLVICFLLTWPVLGLESWPVGALWLRVSC